jgi:sugar/nucleoside kinase (ribokinase family)
MSVGSGRPPRIFCAGIVVLDEVFRVRQVPATDTKTDATEYVTVGGGCAPNAAVAISRLGGTAAFAGPLVGDDTAERILGHLADEKIDTRGCVRVPGGRSSVSAILIDDHGARTIATYSDRKLLAATPRDVEQLIADADGMLLDNRRPNFVGPFCKAAAARKLPIVLDVDKATDLDDPLLGTATHAIFSSESLRATTRCDDLAQGFDIVRRKFSHFIAVTDGHNGGLWCEGDEVHSYPAFEIKVVDTLGAGDTFHGAFALALIEGQPVEACLRFAAAAAAVKCSRFGGISSAPMRQEVEDLLKARA